MFRIRRFGVVRTANVVALLYLVVYSVLILPFAVLFMALGTTPGQAGRCSEARSLCWSSTSSSAGS